MSESGSYEPIASEYYSPRHITSRNFDQATLEFTRVYNLPIPASGLVLDIGAGRGASVKYSGVHPSRVIQADISQTMITAISREACLQRVRCDALKLPFRERSFSAVTAFLFDSFNLPHFYCGLGRTMVEGGIFLGSLPHHEWGATLRKLRRHSPDSATFASVNGKIVQLPSFLSTPSQVAIRLRDADLELVKFYELTLPTSSSPVSPDIQDVASHNGVSIYDLPIVLLFVAVRK